MRTIMSAAGYEHYVLQHLCDIYYNVAEANVT